MPRSTFRTPFSPTVLDLALVSAQVTSSAWTPIETGRRCPAPIAAAIALGAPVQVMARVSTPTDYLGCAANADTVVKELARNEVFLNLPALMPTRESIAHQLQYESVVEQYVDEDGEPFECRFLTLRAPGNGQLHLHLACGSGRKIDAASNHQPVALHAAKFISTVRPVVVCAAEAARWSRNEFTLDPWLRAIGRLEKTYGHPAYFSMDGTPIEFSRTAAMNLIKKAADAASEVEDSRARMIRGIRRQIPSPDLGGYSLYPFSQAPPPPLATVWVQSDSGRRGVQRAVIIDNPGVRDDLGDRIQYGLSKVFESDGVTPVDQLALTRDFLHLHGRPEWPPARLIPSLVSRGFSTEGARRQYGPDFDWRGQTLTRNQIKAITESIEKYIEYFWSGTLCRRVGDRTAPEEAVYLMPPDGEPYLTEEDYHRITSNKKAHQARHRRAHRYTFGHQPATFNGRPGLFVPERAPDGTVTYRNRTATARDADAPRAVPTATSHPACRVPALDFATSLMRGIQENHGDLRIFFPTTGGPGINHAREDLLQLEQALRSRVRTLERLEEQTLPSDKRRGLTGRLLRKANDRYEQVAREIDDLEQAVVRAREAAEREDRLHDPRTIEVTRLLEVVRTLQNPEDVTHHARWRESIRDLAVTSSSVMVGGAHYVRTAWSGTLLMHDGADERALPFVGTSDRRGARKSHAAKVVDDLRRGDARALGTPYWQSSAARELLREALGVPAKEPMPALTIRDPRLLRIAMAAVYPPVQVEPAEVGATGTLRVAAHPVDAEGLAGLAQQMNEPLELIQRVADLNPASGHAPRASRKWETKGDQAVELVCRLAGRRHGRLVIGDFDRPLWDDLRHAAKRCDASLFAFPRGAMVMNPCPHCGSLRRGYLRIREATEPMCWTCRLDVSGISWPGKPYDRYRVRVPRSAPSS